MTISQITVSGGTTVSHLQDAAEERSSIASTVYEVLKNRLMAAEYEPGQQLKLSELVEDLSPSGRLSQTPVREALLRLAAEEILFMERGRSIRVPKYSIAELEELRAIRLELEKMATRLAVPNITPEFIAHLRVVHDEIFRAKENADVRGMLKANYDFHLGIYRCSRKLHLISKIETLYAQTAPSLRYMYEAPYFNMTIDGFHPHIHLLQALKEKNVDLAVSLIEKDITTYGAELVRRMRRSGNHAEV